MGPSPTPGEEQLALNATQGLSAGDGKKPDNTLRRAVSRSQVLSGNAGRGPRNGTFRLDALPTQTGRN
jgi:hypothetical protein